MARDLIIEEVRAVAWTMRLRDPVNGDVVEVPMTPGARFSPPEAAKTRGADGHEDAAPAPSAASTSTGTTGARLASVVQRKYTSYCPAAGRSGRIL